MCLVLLVIGMAAAASHRWGPSSVRAAIRLSPPFDFNDDFYAKNGMDFAQLESLGADSRVGFSAGTKTGSEFGTNPPDWCGTYNWIDDNTNTDPTRGGAHRGIRVTKTTAGRVRDEAR